MLLKWGQLSTLRMIRTILILIFCCFISYLQFDVFKRKKRLNSKFISKISAAFSVRPNIRPSVRIVGHSFDLVLNQSLSYKSTYAMKNSMFSQRTGKKLASVAWWQQELRKFSAAIKLCNKGYRIFFKTLWAKFVPIW